MKFAEKLRLYLPIICVMLLWGSMGIPSTYALQELTPLGFCACEAVWLRRCWDPMFVCTTEACGPENPTGCCFRCWRSLAWCFAITSIFMRWTIHL